MQGRIDREEHVAIEQTVQDSAGFSPPEDGIELKAPLLEIQHRWSRQWMRMASN